MPREAPTGEDGSIEVFYVNSGASYHIIPSRSDLLRPPDVSVGRSTQQLHTSTTGC